MFPSTDTLTCPFSRSLRFGGCFFRDKYCVCFLSDILLSPCARHINSISSPFSVVSLVFILLDDLLVFFLFVGDGIYGRCGKVWCHMNIFLDFCAWLHGHGVNNGCNKTTGVFLGECWNIFGSLTSCWLLMQVFICFSWETLGMVGFGILWSGVLVITTHGGWPRYSEVGINHLCCVFFTLDNSPL